MDTQTYSTRSCCHRDDKADFGLGMGRSMRAMQLFNEAKAMYEQATALPETERQARLEEVHAIVAKKALVRKCALTVGYVCLCGCVYT